jgi:hypothetical protein
MSNNVIELAACSKKAGSRGFTQNVLHKGCI